MSAPNTLNIGGGAFGTTTYNLQSSSTADEKIYWKSGDTAGTTAIYYKISDGKWYDGSSGGQPQAFSINNGTASNPSIMVSSGDDVKLTAGSSGNYGSFTMFSISSGPTVTSITRNESTNLITVLHTGTLTSSDVNHTISNVSSSITNLQTITNGSTFTASSANGTHVIQINDEIISYFIYNTTGSLTTMSSDNNLVVTFPTTDNAWLSNFSALHSETLTPYVSYSNTKTAIRLAIMDYTIWITFNLSYNATQEGYSVLTQIYDWRTTNSSNNYAHVYTSTLQWVYPEATFESTGSADTLITLPTNEIVTSYNWNFASVGAPVTTTSNGGGKPDRYPLIMTNLFNRNRSLYSIGMTHKDTWDLFL